LVSCGPRERANSMTSLNFAFAAATVHVFIADSFIGGILRLDRVTALNNGEGLAIITIITMGDQLRRGSSVI
jgi:hypothetical protein